MRSLPNWVEGARRGSIELTWYEDGSTTPVDLTSATISGYLQVVGVTRAITGTLSVTDGPGGVFRWDLSAADVADSGNLQVQFVAAFASGQTPAKTFKADWYIEAALAMA
jgi:hypothetical protein